MIVHHIFSLMFLNDINNQLINFHNFFEFIIYFKHFWIMSFSFRQLSVIVTTQLLLILTLEDFSYLYDLNLVSILWQTVGVEKENFERSFLLWWISNESDFIDLYMNLLEYLDFACTDLFCWFSFSRWLLSSIRTILYFY